MDETERVRVFFDCDGVCFAVVDHVSRGAKIDQGHIIDMPSSFCEDAWSGIGVKTTGVEKN